MASDLNLINNSYAGEFALPYVSAAVLSADTVAKNLVTVHQNVKDKAVLGKIDITDILQLGDCDFTPGVSGIDSSEAVLTVTDLKVNLRLCKSEHAKMWQSMTMGAGALNEVLPPTFQEYLLALAAAKAGEAVEHTIWKGNFNGNVGGALTYNKFDGLLKKIQVAKTNPDYNIAAALTVGNIMTELDNVLATLPSTLVGDMNTKCFMSRKTYQLYKQRLMTAYNVLVPAGDANLASVYGYEIYVTPGMADNVIMFGRPENLHFGADLLSDYSEALVIDQKLIDGSDYVHVAMKFRAGTQVGFAGDIAIGY
jgi:hypothetical protein